MQLKELMGITPGELIKGITIEKNGIFYLPNKEGWKDLNGYDTEPRELLAVSEQVMSKLLEEEMISRIRNTTHIWLEDVIANTRALTTHVYRIDKPFQIKRSQILGMALGEAIVLFRPLFGGHIRTEYQELIVYYHILAAHGACWVKLTSPAATVNFAENKFRSDIGNLHLYLSD